MKKTIISDSNIDQQIRDIREMKIDLFIKTKENRPLANQEIILGQKTHDFLFGCTGFETIPLANNKLNGEEKEKSLDRHEKLLELFNFITLPFYWGMFEAAQGQPRTEEMLKTAQWYAERNIELKGHTLCWHSVNNDWLLSYSNKEIFELQKARIQREIKDFAGLIDRWDVVNEAVIMPIFDKYDNAMTRLAWEMGRFPLIQAMFQEARSANPGATLVLNDFDMSESYEILIEGCLEKDIPIDVIGLQSHMHQGYWGREKTLRILDRFSRYNIPIHMTEISIVSGELMPSHYVDLNDHQVDQWPSTPEGEARQTEELTDFFKTLMAYPAVEAITIWGIIDGNWLKAPMGLLREDLSEKPAYHALKDLIKGQWWKTPEKLVTDAQGKVSFSGFPGEYGVEIAGEEKVIIVRKKETPEVEIIL